MFALDAKTGNVIWKASNADPKQGQTVTAAPLVIGNKVIVGVSGGEYRRARLYHRVRHANRQAALARL